MLKETFVGGGRAVPQGRRTVRPVGEDAYAETRVDRKLIILVTAFVLLACIVFGFAIMRSRAKRLLPSEGVPVSSAALHQEKRAGTFRLVRTLDGDTFEAVGADKIAFVVRMAGIDAPELDQPYGIEARRGLEEAIADTPFQMAGHKRDKYGRLLGVVYANGSCINSLMVRQGMAWCYLQNPTLPDLADIEQHARTKKLGLWAAASQIPPWEWRKERH